MQLLRDYAVEIEIDLELKGIDIHDWHTQRKKRGVPVLSSRRLVNLVLGGLDDDSVTKKAMRDWDWSEEEYRQAAAVNELRLLRVDQAALQGRTLSYTLMESPAQIKARMEEAQVRERTRERISRQLNKNKRKGAEPE